MWEKRFRERAFLDALEIGRWEAYAAVLVDVAVMIEAKMRPACGPATPDVLADRLTDMVRVNLGRFPVPAHRPAATGWNDIVELAALRIGRAPIAAPMPAHLIGRESARPVFRSEERGVGQEGVSSCRSRWAPDP